MNALSRSVERLWRETCPWCGLALRLDVDDIEILVSALGCGHDDEHPAELEAIFLAGMCGHPKDVAERAARRTTT